MTGQRPRVAAALTPRAEVQVYAGQFGPAGPANQLTVESTTTGPPGSQAQVVISGQAPSQSIAFTIPRGDTGATGATGPPGNPTQWDLRGTGSPEGAVTAPVGSIYTDTVATNGAIRWIKQTGAGATGWRVLWGDTGARSLTTGGWFLNGWAGATSIRRMNDQIWLYLAATPPTDRPTGANVMFNLPVGWRPNPGGNRRWAMGLYALSVGDAAAGRMAVVQYDNATANLSLMSFDNLGANNTLGGELTWFTNNAWPSTLP